MIDLKIKRFCELIGEISALNQRIDYERAIFYNGGHSFEECFESEFNELYKCQDELREIIKYINK